jgi:hypothetical protein
MAAGVFRRRARCRCQAKPGASVEGRQRVCRGLREGQATSDAKLAPGEQHAAASRLLRIPAISQHFESNALTGGLLNLKIELAESDARTAFFVHERL